MPMQVNHALVVRSTVFVTGYAVLFLFLALVVVPSSIAPRIASAQIPITPLCLTEDRANELINQAYFAHPSDVLLRTNDLFARLDQELADVPSAGDTWTASIAVSTTLNFTQTALVWMDTAGYTPTLSTEATWLPLADFQAGNQGVFRVSGTITFTQQGAFLRLCTAKPTSQWNVGNHPTVVPSVITAITQSWSAFTTLRP
ncbi:hypothetical protein HC928_14520 [bacterium]|nr:hypothetical protein [bacterium]